MKSHEIESEIQFLFDSVEFGSDRYYDLDKGPEYVCDQIVVDIDKQNFSDLKVLVLMVMKSYLNFLRVHSCITWCEILLVH